MKSWFTNHFRCHQQPWCDDFYSYQHHSCPNMMSRHRRGDEIPLRICFVHAYNFQLTLCASRLIFGVRFRRRIVWRCYSNTCRYLHQLSLIKFHDVNHVFGSGDAFNLYACLARERRVNCCKKWHHHSGMLYVVQSTGGGISLAISNKPSKNSWILM